MDSDIGIQVKKARETRKYSQQELSGISGLSQVIISRIETNKANPAISTLQRIAKSLNYKIDFKLIKQK